MTTREDGKKGLFEKCKDVVCSRCPDKQACCKEAYMAIGGFST